jgi:hypothetical protein
MLEMLIGLDAEFMAYEYTKQPVYPLLDGDRHKALRSIGCDEFGHCIEVRPKESDTAEGLVLNTIKEMAELPEDFKYMHENVHTMDKKTFIKLLRAQGTAKEIPGCSNINGKDILDDCEMDLEARKAGNRIVFCGMHVHVSAMDVRHQSITIKGETKSIEVKTPIELPVRTLVYLFDRFLFKPMSKDKNFNVGRYRAPGFYERKESNHFEYRSLGSSAFHPQRLILIFKIIEDIIANLDSYTLWNMDSGGEHMLYTERMVKLVAALSATKPSTKDLRQLWVPWI